MTALIILLGLAGVGIAIAGNTWVYRREFYRRNRAGVQEFAGFGTMLKTRTAENAVRVVTGLIGIAGIFIMSFGLIK